MPNSLELMRPHQWIKNGFVFAAPLFAKKLGDPSQLGLALIAFACFCLTSSAVYVMNDLIDLERDRAHPRKRNRVLASGRLSARYAGALMAVLLAVSLGVSLAFVSPLATGVLALYAGGNVLYSLVLKHVVILDVGFIAFGFILRVLAGAAATGAAASHWLLLCTFNVSLFLGFAKRRAELAGHGGGDHREVLSRYSEGFLDQMIAVVTSATLVCYILYTVDDRTAEIFGHRGLVVTVPFVMYGIFRYLYLTYHEKEGESPARTILMDPLFLLNNVAWAASCVAIIYWGSRFAEWIP